MPKAHEIVVALAGAVAEKGGRALVVGGSVRDGLLGIAPVDYDVEVYGLAPEVVEAIVREFGEVSDVGKGFAILKLVVDGADIDVSLPRSDSKVAPGHKGFAVAAHPDMTPTEAARRRDFTMNAIAQDPLTGELVDPYRGRDDLKNKVLRVVDAEMFGDDPLRVLRAMQFVARFGLTVDPDSFALMKGMQGTLKELPRERIGGEWRKLLMQSEKPSLGLHFAMDVGIIEELHPEVLALAGTPQEPEWHPEGNVWVHSCMVVDEAAAIARREALDDDTALTMMLGALCHDFGKPCVTRVEEGRVRSHGHEDAGAAPTKAFLHALAIGEDTRDKVVGIVRDHMKPFRLWHEETEKGTAISDGAIRRLAARIDPATIAELVLVTEADFRGRGPFPVPGKPGEFAFPGEYHAGAWLRDRAKKLGVFGAAPEHLVRGGEIIDLGYPPGPGVGQIVRLADDLRDEKDFCHYNIVTLLREVPADQSGNRDAAQAIERMKLELD
ncbi:HD domain-containing protein [Candidatus Uhrbacteria bacterium]|nr:HD domain-containing protein [Candidatus Uhrbacteria bacterium]